MSIFIFDTNIVLGYLRGAPYAKYVESKFSPNAPPNTAIISIVSTAELYSLAIQLRWDEKRQASLAEILRQLPQVDINRQPILKLYAEIDAYSQGKHPGKPLPNGLSARNMGKNDVWIAATAAAAKGVLITTDRDFNHLNGQYLRVEYVDPKAV